MIDATTASKPTCDWIAAEHAVYSNTSMTRCMVQTTSDSVCGIKQVHLHEGVNGRMHTMHSKLLSAVKAALDVSRQSLYKVTIHFRSVAITCFELASILHIKPARH